MVYWKCKIICCYKYYPTIKTKLEKPIKKQTKKTPEKPP